MAKSFKRYGRELRRRRTLFAVKAVHQPGADKRREGLGVHEILHDLDAIFAKGRWLVHGKDFRNCAGPIL
jgi:hypothetical protein